MKLTRKLLLSYLLVAAVGLLVLAISTAFIAPANFRHMSWMRGQGVGMGQHMQQLTAQLDADFRQSVNNALLLAGITAIITASAASWLVSQQIVNPIRALVKLSQYIASGHYHERLTTHSSDELGELTRSFNQMAEALAETETMRRQLLADVSHELKTPLASIKGYMEGLQDNVLPATPATFQLVYREASRLERLVEDLQVLSRAEAGQVDLHPSACDPARIVEDVVSRMRPQFVEKDIRLDVEAEDNLPPVQADPDRTEQILTNLLGNALQYTPSGGHVTARMGRRGSFLQVSIQDSGVGLAAVDLEQVFRRFYRVDRSRARASGGSGIGLTITRYLVEAQGGQIWAESQGLNQGSTFHFMLPLA